MTAKRKPSALQKLRDEVLKEVTRTYATMSWAHRIDVLRAIRRVFARRAKRRGRK